ncbi:hypothetical protein [Paenibacillus sp. y28]|uniref:hypothetical protein n=1 Tax=Paenibacillus sp. y28 TaxID=3129110 RepID=UPI003018969F
MQRKNIVTVILTSFSVVLCLFNALGLDPEDMFFFSLSIPVWIIETFSDIHRYNAYFVYALTIASYALIGLFGDRFVQTRRTRRRAG